MCANVSVVAAAAAIEEEGARSHYYCKCARGWGGAHCEEHCAGEGCSGRGDCLFRPPPLHSVCACDRGWSGEGCESTACPRPPPSTPEPTADADPAECAPSRECCGHGLCARGECRCERGYHGPACERFELEDARS